MPDAQRVPEIYADMAQISVDSVGVFLGFRAVNPMSMLSLEATDAEADSESSLELKAVARFSLTNAKIFAILLKRFLKEYEEDSGEIVLPSAFVEAANLEDDEW